MPNRVTLTCTKCGPVNVEPADITIETIKKVYRFACPLCAKTMRKPLTADAMRKLVRSGAQVRPWPTD